MTTTERSACTLLPSETGLVCSLQAGHSGTCAPSPGPAPATAPVPPKYGFTKKVVEQDLALPSGDVVRIRKLTMSQLFKLRITELRDVFAGDLLADDQESTLDEDAVNKVFEETLLDPERSSKLLEPIDRVVVAAVLCPTVVAEGPTNDDQINVDEIDITDKIVIFGAAAGDQLAAFGGQQDALKSLQSGPETGVRDLPAGNSIQSTA